jgi:hypothetical protein
MRSYYEQLKSSMERVRNRSSYEQAEQTGLSEEHIRKQEQRQQEDLNKLDILIKQLTDRWNQSYNMYKNR